MLLKITKTLFFFLLLFTPLAFGTTEPWSVAIMEIGTALALCLFLIHQTRHKEPVYTVPGLVPLTLLLAFMLFQLLPLPPAVVNLLSPSAFDIHQTNQTITATKAWMTLTVHPGATVSEFFRYLTYVLFYVLTVQLLARKGTLQTTALTIVIFGGLLAFSSILQFYLTEDMALWFRHTPTNSIVVGPYVNHNHYAGLMEMIFPVVLGLFLFYRPRIGSTSLVKGIAEMWTQEKANIHILIGTAAVLIVVSIFVSLSRGGMISTCLALLVFTALLLKRKISRGSTLLIIGLVFLTALSIGWFGWDQIIERFARLKNTQGVIYEARLDFWTDTLGMIRHFILTGAGFGAFSHVYPLHRSLAGDFFLNHAHNDYLELLAEGGLIGFALSAVFMAVLLAKTYRTFLTRRDAFSIYLYMGCVTALTSILLHSFTDFNLHIGANGLWFFFTAGLAVAAANTGIRKNSRMTRLVPVSSGIRQSAAVSTVCLVALMTIIFNISGLTGLFYFSNIRNVALDAYTPVPYIEKIEKVAHFAALFDPLHAEYRYTLANTAWFTDNRARSRDLFKTALHLNPLNSKYLNRYATLLALEGDPKRAELAFHRSMRYDRSNPEPTFQYAAWRLANNDMENGLPYMKKTLEMAPEYMERVLTAMIVAGIDSDTIEQAVPDTPGPTIEFARFLYDTGEFQKAVDRFLRAVDLIETMTFPEFMERSRADNIRKSHFFSVFHFFKQYNDLKNAMQVMERAEKALPMDPGVKNALGDLYYRQGILFKALDKYDYALLLDPGNAHALKMIKTINP